MLNQTKFLSAFGFVVGIKNFRNTFPHRLLPDCLHVPPLVKDLKIELLGGFCFPQSKKVHGSGSVPDDGQIIRNSLDLLSLDPLGPVIPQVVVRMLDPAVKKDFLGVLRADDFPWVSVFQPIVRALNLSAVFKFLTEQAELIMNAIPDGRKIHCRHGIQKTSSQSAQPSVAQAHVMLFFA